VNGGNPAVPGSGGPACPATDQRGLYRGGSAGRCDVGAFELGATVSPPSGPITTPPNTPNTSNMVGAAHKKCKKKKHKRAAAAKKKKCKRGKK
jgi:hypothetical protein